MNKFVSGRSNCKVYVGEQEKPEIDPQVSKYSNLITKPNDWHLFISQLINLPRTRVIRTQYIVNSNLAKLKFLNTISLQKSLQLKVFTLELQTTFLKNAFKKFVKNFELKGQKLTE